MIEKEPPNRFGLNDHNLFVRAMSSKFARRSEEAIGWSLSAMGMTLAVTGMVDFLSGGTASEWLRNLDFSQAPELVKQIMTWSAEHLADTPFLMKLGGGSAQIKVGTLLVGHSLRKK